MFNGKQQHLQNRMMENTKRQRRMIDVLIEINCAREKQTHGKQQPCDGKSTTRCTKRQRRMSDVGIEIN